MVAMGQGASLVRREYSAGRVSPNPLYFFGGSLAISQRRCTRRPTLVGLRVHPVSSVKETVALLLVRTEEEIISRVRHQLSLTHYASGRGNRSSSGI